MHFLHKVLNSYILIKTGKHGNLKNQKYLKIMSIRNAKFKFSSTKKKRNTWNDFSSGGKKKIKIHQLTHQQSPFPFSGK